MGNGNYVMTTSFSGQRHLGAFGAAPAAMLMAQAFSDAVTRVIMDVSCFEEGDADRRVTGLLSASLRSLSPDWKALGCRRLRKAGDRGGRKTGPKGEILRL